MNNTPAFPPMHDPNTHEFGMTLRDYFAAKAMQAVLASKSAEEYTDQDIAKIAYMVSDAMLKAREA